MSVKKNPAAIVTRRIRETQIGVIITRLQTASHRLQQPGAYEDEFAVLVQLDLLKALYNDHQRKFDDLLKVMPADEFSNRMVEVDSFDRLYLTTCATAKRLLSQFKADEKPYRDEYSVVQIQSPAVPMSESEVQTSPFIAASIAHH
jgi:hypothetical protein